MGGSREYKFGVGLLTREEPQTIHTRKEEEGDTAPSICKNVWQRSVG